MQGLAPPPSSCRHVRNSARAGPRAFVTVALSASSCPNPTPGRTSGETTTARIVPGGYSLSGVKTWISTAHRDPVRGLRPRADAELSFTAFIVDRKPGPEGGGAPGHHRLTPWPPGVRDCVVPEDARLGSPAPACASHHLMSPRASPAAELARAPGHLLEGRLARPRCRRQPSPLHLRRRRLRRWPAMRMPAPGSPSRASSGTTHPRSQGGHGVRAMMSRRSTTLRPGVLASTMKAVNERSASASRARPRTGRRCRRWRSRS